MPRCPIAGREVIAQPVQRATAKRRLAAQDRGVEIAACHRQRTDQRGARAIERGFADVTPCKPAGADELELLHLQTIA